jgi:glycosyltransferase involved in cell wall biosynthesis
MVSPAGEAPELPPIDVLVCTFNAGPQLAESLASARRYLPIARLILVDHHSDDETRGIATENGAEIHLEDKGLGYARTLALQLATTDHVVFLDADAILRRPDFYAAALREMAKPNVGAVVAGTVGHPFLYGLPMSLTLLPRKWALRVQVPDRVQGRETFYFQAALRRDRLRVAYVPDSIEHRSLYRRRHWPEWQGAQIRRVAGWNPRELLYALVVTVLIHVNSRRARDAAYVPIFYLKILRGFLDPRRWGTVDRRRPEA